MTAIERIVEQMRAAFEGGAWHGPALMEVLKDVSAFKAGFRPYDSTHSIFSLVLHISATQAVLLRRINGEDAGLNESDFWEEPPKATDENWANALYVLASQEAALRRAVAQFAESKLDLPLMPSGTSSAYTNFHGHIQHMLYHAGQIALLKKPGNEIPF